MIAAWHVFRKELAELGFGLRGLLLVFVLPVSVVLLVGQLQVQTPVMRTLVVGPTAEDDEEQWRARSLLVRLLVEAAAFDVASQDGSVADPLRTLREGGYDLLVAAHDDAAGEWRIFTAETNPKRLATIELAIAGLERAIPSVLEQAEREVEAANDDEAAEDAFVRQLAALATLSTGSRFLYFPAAADRRHATLPMTIGLIVCFLPFVLAAPSLVRERTARMLEVILAAPGVGPAANFLGRSAASTGATLLAFLSMIVTAWVAYGFHPKAGLGAIVLALLPALFSSTCLGLAASSLARSQAQATAASAAWFLWLLLTSGVLFPLEQSSSTIQVLALLSPLTPIHDLFNAWMFGAPWSAATLDTLAPLALQSSLFAIFAWLAYMRMLRNL